MLCLELFMCNAVGIQKKDPAYPQEGSPTLELYSGLHSGHFQLLYVYM